jgi:hypothetical protein
MKGILAVLFTIKTATNLEYGNDEMNYGGQCLID